MNGKIEVYITLEDGREVGFFGKMSQLNYNVAPLSTSSEAPSFQNMSGQIAHYIPSDLGGYFISMDFELLPSKDGNPTIVVAEMP